MQLPLRGIIPPLVTPMNGLDQLDPAGLERLIELQVSGGVHGLFILGTNGEAPSLGQPCKKELIRRSCELAGGRVPVLVGISHTSITESLEIADYAGQFGADALVVAPPYYYPIEEDDLLSYFETLCSKLSLPFLLYNLPSHTKIHLSVELARRAREWGAAGIKDSSGDMLYFYSLVEAFRGYPDFSVLCGTEMYLPEAIMNGGHGAVTGGANMFPEMFVDLYNASVKKDLETVSRLREKVMLLHQTIYQLAGDPSRFVKGIKSALSVMGICEDYMAPPLRSLPPSRRVLMEEYIERIKR